MFGLFLFFRIVLLMKLLKICVKNIMKVFIMFWINVRVIMLLLVMWLILWVRMVFILLGEKCLSRFWLIVISVLFLF